MKEHDIIVSTEDFKNISKGEKGTIVYVYSKDNFEVEFDNKRVVTANSKQIKKLDKQKK